MGCRASKNGTMVLQIGKKQTYFAPQDAYAQLAYIQRKTFFTGYFNHMEHFQILPALTCPVFLEMYRDSDSDRSKTLILG